MIGGQTWEIRAQSLSLRLPQVPHPFPQAIFPHWIPQSPPSPPSPTHLLAWSASHPSPLLCSFFKACIPSNASSIKTSRLFAPGVKPIPLTLCLVSFCLNLQNSSPFILPIVVAICLLSVSPARGGWGAGRAGTNSESSVCLQHPAQVQYLCAVSTQCTYQGLRGTRKEKVSSSPK